MKFVEANNGMRIPIATAPEPDVANLNRKSKSLDALQRVTGLEDIRTDAGLDMARRDFTAQLKASRGTVLSAPAIWRAFATDFQNAQAGDRQKVVDGALAAIAAIPDSAIRTRMAELVGDFANGTEGLGDMDQALMPEIGRKHEAEVVAMANRRAKEIDDRRQEFEHAISEYDDAVSKERKAL